MPYRALVFPVVIASPSDQTHERETIKHTIHQWNDTHAHRLGVMLEPVMWESHSTPELGDRPQAIINRQLIHDADVLIASFWTRLGTPTGTAESGTVEEIEQFISDDRPVLLYFCNKPVEPSAIDTKQYELLSEFKNRLSSGGLYHEYATDAELLKHLRQHLTTVISKLSEAPPPRDGHEGELNPLLVFADEFQAFARRFKEDWETDRASEPISIDDAKFALEHAVDNLLDFQQQIADDTTGDVTGAIREAIIDAKVLKQHQVVMDGGQSYDELGCWRANSRSTVCGCRKGS